MRLVTIEILASVKDESDAKDVAYVISKLGEHLSATGHNVGVRVGYVERPEPARVIDPSAN